MPEPLTKDAEKLICLMYKGYLEKRKSGESKSVAKHMGSSDNVHDLYDSNSTLEDTVETCCELSRAGFLHCEFADDDIYFMQLSDAAIIHMESRFPNGVKDVLDWLGKIKGAIPFL